MERHDSSFKSITRDEEVGYIKDDNKNDLSSINEEKEKLDKGKLEDEYEINKEN